MTRAMILTCMLAACGKAVPADSKDAQAIFAAYCATCHGPDGRPPAAMVARLNVRDLTSQELRARISPELVEKQIRRGSENKLMPSFDGVLHDVQITAVAQWVASPSFVTPPR
jgi:mono/diheme cytochrome c family protein